MTKVGYIRLIFFASEIEDANFFHIDIFEKNLFQSSFSSDGKPDLEDISDGYLLENLQEQIRRHVSTILPSGCGMFEIMGELHRVWEQCGYDDYDLVEWLEEVKIKILKPYQSASILEDIYHPIHSPHVLYYVKDLNLDKYLLKEINSLQVQITLFKHRDIIKDHKGENYAKKIEYIFR